MSHRLKHAVPLAISIALVAFVWSEVTLNFNLHWFTVADGVFGEFGLPEKFQFVLPATFVTWGTVLRARCRPRRVPQHPDRGVQPGPSAQS